MSPPETHRDPKPAPSAPLGPEIKSRRQRQAFVSPTALGGHDFLETSSSFHGGPRWRSRGYALVAWSFVATVIDACVVLGMACLFLFVTLWIEKTGVQMAFLERSLILKSGALIFLFLHITYLLSLRIVIGSSVGEWACGLKLGEPRMRLSPRYSLQVLWRFAIVMGTGIVSLPILSALTGQDWAGRLSGLPLITYDKKTN